MSIYGLWDKVSCAGAGASITMSIFCPYWELAVCYFLMGVVLFISAFTLGREERRLIAKRAFKAKNTGTN